MKPSPVAGLGSVRLAAAVRRREKGEKAQSPAGEPATVARPVEPASGTGGTAPGASATTHGAAGFGDTRPPMQG